MDRLKKLACALICGCMISATALPAHADKVGELTEDVLVVVVVAVAGVFLLTSPLRDSSSSLDSGDDEGAAQILDEYQRGMGIRLNDPGSAFRVSTMATHSQTWTTLNGAVSFAPQHSAGFGSGIDTGLGPDFGARTFNIPQDTVAVEFLTFSYQFD